jgi:hypothetical protein
MCFFPSVFSEHRNTTWGRDFTSILLAPLSVLEIHGLSFFFGICIVMIVLWKWWKMMENDAKWWKMMGMFSKVATCRSQLLSLMVSTRWRDEPRASQGGNLAPTGQVYRIKEAPEKTQSQPMSAVIFWTFNLRRISTSVNDEQILV